MKRLLFALVLTLGAVACQPESASAQHPHPYGFGFQPFGFYQPYGAQFGTRMRTPPYFATHPPVYYGARHARPYGISPFAAPPMVGAPSSYTGRLRSQFVDLPASSAPYCNPYVHNAPGHTQTAGEPGKVRRNPYVEPTESLAQNDAS